MTVVLPNRMTLWNDRNTWCCHTIDYFLVEVKEILVLEVVVKVRVISVLMVSIRSADLREILGQMWRNLMQQGHNRVFYGTIWMKSKHKKTNCCLQNKESWFLYNSASLRWILLNISKITKRRNFVFTFLSFSKSSVKETFILEKIN